jgi:hypothetical protein
MNFKKNIAAFIIVFAISLLVTLGVTFLENLFSRGTYKVDWETSFRFAILFAIILPIAGSRKARG